MAAIPSNQVPYVLTGMLVTKYDELLEIKPTLFFQNLFKKNITKVRYPMYDVRRGSEQVAVDVQLGHQGIRTQITKATAKVIDPFYYRYFFDATELDIYWRVFGSNSVNINDMAELANGIMLKQKENMDLILRGYEIQAAQVLEFGTCTSFNDGSVVNFNRKSASMVDLGAGNYWAVTGHDPYVDIENAAIWIRQYGKYSGGVVNVIMGQTAYDDFMTNTVVMSRNDIKQWKVDDINAPEMKAEGNVYHGTVSCGSYVAHIWTYPQFYDMPGTLVSTPYWNPKKIVVLPPNPKFELIYAATPQLNTVGENTASLISGEFVFQECVFQWDREHRFGQESRGLTVPLAIDTFVTVQVCA